MKKKIKVRVDKSDASAVLDDCITNKKVIPRRVFQIMIENAETSDILTDTQLASLLKGLPWTS